jgi:hypothetical protein
MDSREGKKKEKGKRRALIRPPVSDHFISERANR